MPHAAPQTAAPALTFGGAEIELAAMALEWLAELAGERRVSATRSTPMRATSASSLVSCANITANRRISPRFARSSPPTCAVFWRAGAPQAPAAARCCASSPACAPLRAISNARGSAKSRRFLPCAAQKRPAVCQRPCRPNRHARWSMSSPAPVTHGLTGFWRAIPPSSACSMARACAFPKPCRSNATTDRRNGYCDCHRQGREGPQRAGDCAVQRAIARYLSFCPWPLPSNGPLFVGAKGGALSPRIIQLAVAELRRRARPAGDGDAACIAPFLRDASSRQGRRSAHDSGIARPRVAFDDADLHGDRFGAAARSLSRRTPPRPLTGASGTIIPTVSLTRRCRGVRKPRRGVSDERIKSESQPEIGRAETRNEEISRDRLAQLLNEDLSREYQAIIAYVVYSQVLKGAEYMNIADQLELHAKQELDHALTLSRLIDYLGAMPSVTPKPVRTSEKAKEMLRFDLDNGKRNDPELSPACPPM